MGADLPCGRRRRVGGPRDAPMAVPPGQMHLETPLWLSVAGCPGHPPSQGSGERQKDPDAARNESLPSLQPRSWVLWGDGAAQPLGDSWEQLSPQVPPAVAALTGDVKE